MMVLGRWSSGVMVVLRRRFVRICPDFRIFGGCGRIEGCYGVSPPPPADGWVADFASFVLRGASFSNLKNFQKSERRLSFRLCDPGEPPQPEVAGGSGRRVLSRGHAAR